MAWPKGKRRTTKPKDADLRAKLLITMHSRDEIWLVGDPEPMKKLREQLTREMNALTTSTAMDLAPHFEKTIRVSAIDSVEYIPPKSASESEPEPKAKQP